MWVQSLGQEDSLEEGTQHTPVFSPGEPHGQRSLVGYSHWAVQSWIQLKQVNIACAELYLCITKVNTISILKK